MSTKDRDDDDDAPCASPHRKDAASIRSLLDDAHAQGRQLERRAQRPLFALSLVLLFGGVSSYAVLRNTPYRAITSFLMPMSVIVLNAALLPTNRWGIRTMVLLLSLTLITLGCAVAAETAASLALVSADTIGSTRRCATAPHLSLSGGSTSEYVPCWFINWNAYLSLIKAAAVLATGVRFAATLVHWRRPRRLLHHLWRAFFWIVVMIGVICCEMLLAALARARPANFYVGGVLLVASLGLVLFVHYRPELRERFYAWRLRQGAGVVSAGAIATLISVAASDDGGTVGARGLASLRSLRADKLSVEQMSSNAPDPALYAATEPALVGEIDAFISHSWRDEPDEKWALLQAWRARFVNKYGREPTLWLDKACIDPAGSLVSQLALLPIYAASCSRFVVLFTPTYLTRLWCVAELFVWMHVGRADHIFICLPNPSSPSEDADTADSTCPPATGAGVQSAAASTRPSSGDGERPAGGVVLSWSVSVGSGLRRPLPPGAPLPLPPSAARTLPLPPSAARTLPLPPSAARPLPLPPAAAPPLPLPPAAAVRPLSSVPPQSLNPWSYFRVDPSRTLTAVAPRRAASPAAAPRRADRAAAEAPPAGRSASWLGPASEEGAPRPTARSGPHEYIHASFRSSRTSRTSAGAAGAPVQADAERLASARAFVGGFDVRAAQCTDPVETDMLLSVIEVSHGSLHAFSATLRGVLLDAIATTALRREDDYGPAAAAPRSGRRSKSGESNVMASMHKAISADWGASCYANRWSNPGRRLVAVSKRRAASVAGLAPPRAVPISVQRETVEDAALSCGGACAAAVGESAPPDGAALDGGAAEAALRAGAGDPPPAALDGDEFHGDDDDDNDAGGDIMPSPPSRPAQSPPGLPHEYRHA